VCDCPAAPLRDRLSVVLLTYNCAHRIEPTLKHLVALGLPLIVVDNGSADETVELLAGRDDLELIHLPTNMGAAGRNAGAFAAQTPYVLFCDDDGWYEPDALEHVCDIFEAHPELAVVNARITVGPDYQLDPISAEMADSPLPGTPELPGTTLLGFMAGAVAVRVSAYQEVGGYDERFFIGGEEETLAVKFARAGWQMRYLPELVMHHEPSLASAAGLRAVGMRNTLVNAWLHRPWRSALRWTVFTLADNPKNADWLRGVGLTLRTLPWILRERDPMDPELDAQLTILDRRRFAGRRPLFTRRGWQPGDPLRPEV
jgi:GT2 family glycosyltransferase